MSHGPGNRITEKRKLLLDPELEPRSSFHRAKQLLLDLGSSEECVRISSQVAADVPLRVAWPL